MSGEKRIVVATNAFGMGVDKSDVRLVVHWQLPGTLEAYYQEAGRGGRDGAPARCVALYARRDAELQRGFVDRSRPSRRGLLRVLDAVKKRVPPGERGSLGVHDLVKALGRDWSAEGVEGALAALAASRALRVLEESAPDSAPDRVLTLGVHSGLPDLERARSLREAALEKLWEVQRYARVRGCRRRALLAYFGEDGAPRRCEACDRCLGPADSVAAELATTRRAGLRRRGALWK
jgi:ATP-dependent DNA helicase RecQ